MTKAESTKKLLHAMVDFNAAYSALKTAIEHYEQETNTSVNDLRGFVESYPFDKSFDELPVGEWVTHTIERATQGDYKVLSYEYLNTGGNTMVGIFEVWLPELKRVVYALTNEEGCTLAHVDYLRNDLEIDDYDELIIECVDWGRMTGYEKYFELYRHCLNEYTKSDCKYFGYTCGLSYHLLSDELQKQVDADYLAYCESEHGGLIGTDGNKVIVYPCYEKPTAEYNDECLQRVKDFRQWHTDVAGDVDTRESMYDKDYQLTLAGKTVLIPFNADTWDAVDSLLQRTIEEW